jgi:hypothetical protein
MFVFLFYFFFHYFSFLLIILPTEQGAAQASNISDAEIEAAKQEWADLVLSDEE